MRKIRWSTDAADELLEILAFQKDHYGVRKAETVYSLIHEKVLVTKAHPESGRVVPELEVIGINDIRELIESPWRILYESSEEAVEILSVIDGRRNFEEILYRKILDGKIV